MEAGWCCGGARRASRGSGSSDQRSIPNTKTPTMSACLCFKADLPAGLRFHSCLRNLMDVAESEPGPKGTGSCKAGALHGAGSRNTRFGPGTESLLGWRSCPELGRRDGFTPDVHWLLGWCSDGVWVLFENSTVCFVCDSAKFFVWLRPFFTSLSWRGRVFWKQPVLVLFLFAWICFSYSAEKLLWRV